MILDLYKSLSFYLKALKKSSVVFSSIVSCLGTENTAILATLS